MNDLSPLPSIAVDSDASCSAAIERLGVLARDLARIETVKAETVAAAAKFAEDEATPLLSEKAALEAKVAAWCEAERARLTGNGSTKTVGFSSGSVAWRDSVEVCEIDGAAEKKIVGRVKKIVAGKLAKIIGFWAPFVTIGVTLSKTALKAPTLDQKTKTKLRRAGIKVVKPPESFAITPAGASLAERP